MSDISMNKAIHGAFRRDLTRFIGALGAFQPGDVNRAKELGVAWDNFEDQLHHHHTGEHDIAWPALVAIGVSPDLLTSMDSEHDTMAAALSDASTAMADLRRTAGQAEAAAALAAMQRLQTVTTEHLDHEEAELEDVYLSNREHSAIKEMGRKFGKVSPTRGGRFFAWLLDGATPAEAAAIRADIPPPVLSVILAVFGRGYRKNIAPVWR